MEDITEKKSWLKIVNVLFVIFMVSGIGIFLIFGTIGITNVMLLPFLLANYILAILYHRSKKDKKYRKWMLVVRFVAISLSLIIIGSPFVGANFTTTRVMYPIKRAVFVCGVKTRAADIFPVFLKGKCEDYYFITQLNLPAPDYHPHAVLSFRCDEETMQEYIVFAEEHNFNRCYKQDNFREQYKEELLEADRKYIFNAVMHYLDFDGYPVYRLSDTFDLDNDQLIQFAEDAEVYENNGITCCIIDRTTGYILFSS